MSDPNIHIPSMIVSNGVGDRPFLDFQTSPAGEDAEHRHYFECVAATLEVNANLFQFEESALHMIAAGFKSRKPLTINHDKGWMTHTLGFGATVDAVVDAGQLYVAAYIALNKSYPQGPFKTAEELRDGLVDGFVNSVSQSCYPIKARCSVCNQPYPTSEMDYANENFCKHYRGQQVVVKSADKKQVETVHVIIEAAEAIELSLVQIPADRGTGITRKAISFAVNDFIDADRCHYLNNNGYLTHNLTHGGPTVSAITQEQIDAMQLRAETAEKELATVRVQLNANQGEATILKSQQAALESQKTALETQVSALESQVKTANAERDYAKKELDSATEASTAKSDEIGKLRKEMEENKVAIADGLAVRSQFEQAYVDAYVAAVGDACTDDMKTQQAEVAKSFSIDILKQKTEGFRDAAKINYPAGKVIKPTDSGDAGADPEAYPIGV